MITHTSFQGSTGCFSRPKLHIYSLWVRSCVLFQPHRPTYQSRLMRHSVVIIYNNLICKLSTIMICFFNISCREKFSPPPIPPLFAFCTVVFFYILFFVISLNNANKNGTWFIFSNGRGVVLTKLGCHINSGHFTTPTYRQSYQQL